MPFSRIVGACSERFHEPSNIEMGPYLYGFPSFGIFSSCSYFPTSRSPIFGRLFYFDGFAGRGRWFALFKRPKVKQLLFFFFVFAVESVKIVCLVTILISLFVYE